MGNYSFRRFGVIYAYRRSFMLHAGQLIEQTLREQGRSVTWFAARLCCTRPNVYKIFRKENIDIYLLWRISDILEHDFFYDLSQARTDDGVAK